MIASLLAKIGIPILTTVLSEPFGTLNNEEAQKAAESLKRVNRTLSAEQISEANRHTETIANLALKADADRLV